MQKLVPIDTIPELLEPVKEVVSKPQYKQIERIIRGILLIKGRCTIEAIRQALVEHVSVGSLNHFLAESPWSEELVHGQVLAVLESKTVVAPRATGILYADDTLTGEHYGKQMEGLAKYRDVTSSGMAYIHSHCLVTLHYSHHLTQAERRRTGQRQRLVEYWLDYRLYRRQAELAENGLQGCFQTKPQLLIKMLRAQDWSRLPARTLAFDHHYLTPAVVQAAHDLGLHWLSKAGKNDFAWWQEQWLRLDEVVKRIPCNAFQAVSVQTSKGRRRYWVCKRRLCLRTLYGGEQELTVVFSKTSRGATKAVYLATDHTWSARRVVRTYALRWTIETGHKQEKHLLAVADYQMTRLKTIQRFWRLNLLAYALLALLRFGTHPLAQELMPDVRTLGQARQFLDVISLLAFVTLVIALAQLYDPDDIVRRLFCGLQPPELCPRVYDQTL